MSWLNQMMFPGFGGGQRTPSFGMGQMRDDGGRAFGFGERAFMPGPGRGNFYRLWQQANGLANEQAPPQVPGYRPPEQHAPQRPPYASPEPTPPQMPPNMGFGNFNQPKPYGLSNLMPPGIRPMGGYLRGPF
jgi:hypothetical protein